MKKASHKNRTGFRYKGIDFIFGLFIIISLFSGCSKDNGEAQYKVNGQVTDFTTGKGLPFASIQEYYMDTSKQRKLVTDSGGFFNLTYVEEGGDPGIAPSLVAHANNYFDNSRMDMMPFYNGLVMPIQLIPVSFLNIHYTTSSKNDTVVFNATIRRNGAIIASRFPNDFLYPIIYKDTITQNNTLSKPIAGGLMNHFSWTIKKNGTSQTFSDSIKINAFDSANYDIVF